MATKENVKVMCPFCFEMVTPKKNKKQNSSSEKNEEQNSSSSDDYFCSNEKCKSSIRGIPLPHEVFDHEVFPIAIVGASSSGKTYYLTALAHEFSTNPIWENDFWHLAFVHYAKEKRQEQMDNIWIENMRILYEYKRKLNSTLKKEDEYRPPLLLSVTYLVGNKCKWIFNEPYRKRKLLLVFHDVPGEFTTDDNGRMVLEDRYSALRVAKAIIVLAEPNELDKLRDQLKTSDQSLVASTATKAVMGLRYTEQYRKPVAVCLSKSDLFLNLKNDCLQYLSGNMNTKIEAVGTLDLDDIQNVSDSIRDIFKDYGGEKLLSLVDKSFRYSSFFAFSSYGVGMLDNNKNIKADAELHPLRIMDPILWILWQYGLLGGKCGK